MNDMNQDSPQTTPHPYRLQSLRDAMHKLGLDGFLIPTTDSYLNEYVASRDKRIKFLTGFSGSSAFVIVLKELAAFFTDGRYTLQAKDQIPPELYILFNTAKKTPSEWLQENLSAQMKIGFDPQLHTAQQIERLKTSIAKQEAELVAVTENPIDALWTERPDEIIRPFHLHDALYTGKSSAEKRLEIGEELKKKKLDAALITDPTSIAWLLNIRGNDVPFTPLPCAQGIIHANGTVEWFVDPRKVTPAIDQALGADVTRFAPEEFPSAIYRLGQIKAHVLINPSETSFYMSSLAYQSGAVIKTGDDPCALPRACKNETEIKGMRAAHKRDGVALVKLMAWLHEKGTHIKITELGIEEILATFRAEGNLYKGASFSTIAGSGPNGAIVHYRATNETNRSLDMNSFLLLDSGGQYLDGTTDVTRTIALGEPTHEMCDRYTRVLKGHIAIANLRFPEGTSGADMDILARQYLWAVGLDYSHGTGHGVGSYLSVHEGPHGISKRSPTPLKVGMITSNEPGFYKAHEYGIRLENLQLVVDLPEISPEEQKMLGFEPLTLAPFDRRAILIQMLSADEIEWINSYHTQVLHALKPQLDEQTALWLAKATQPL